MATSSREDDDEHDEKDVEQGGSLSNSADVYLFAEEAEAFQLIADLLPNGDDDVQGDDDDRGDHQGNNDDQPKPLLAASTRRSRQLSALARLRTIFDAYLECPTLLDQSLEGLVTKIATQARALMDEGNENSTATTTSTNDSDRTRAIKLAIRCHLSVLYGLSKVRGRKIVQRFLPHEVHDVEPVWEYFLVNELVVAADTDDENVHAVSDDTSSPHPCLPQRWESVYMLWNWTAVLSLVPFDCSVVVGDSGGGGDGGSGEDRFASTLVSHATECLSDAGPIREAAASCLAAWITRVDLEATQLPSFIQFASQVVDEYRSRPSCSSCLFRMLGVLRTLATVLKQSSVDRTNLVILFRPLWDAFLSIDSWASSDRNLLLRKLLIKWWTRMACAFLPPAGVAAWRYQRGNRSLQVSSIATTMSGATSTSHSLNTGRTDCAGECLDALWNVIDPVEEGVGRLIESLGHSSTVVRWSAAKGIGRVAERLPAALCAEDVLGAILVYFDDAERDNCWHGACLALAEMARRGLLLPSRLGDVVPRIVAAIQYDLPRGHKSVGAHVRDAACYAYWAFARAYSPEVLQPYIRSLNDAIILTSLFDREVNCRRAASAAFQEAVGRQGATTFPNGIAILTCADYFSLGNRVDAYTRIAKTIAEYEEYRRPIIRHLFTIKLANWDPTIRDLASKSLALLTELDPSFVADVTIPYLLDAALDPVNLNRRHGATLGVAEVTLALSRTNEGLHDVLSPATMATLVALAPTIEKRRLYRGRGGEIMRAAVCRLVECIALSMAPLSTPEQVQLLDCIDGSIPHPSSAIQTAACRALEQLLTRYFPVRETGPTARLQARVVDKFVHQVQCSDNPGATRGYALALGFLPSKLLAPQKTVVDSLLDCLFKAARYDSLVGGESDAETRRNALQSLCRISVTVGVRSESQKNSYPTVPLDVCQVQRLFDSYLLALKDYKSDNRGDVGCWCRMEAMGGIATLVRLLSDHPSHAPIADETLAYVVTEVLKQASEQLDVVRSKAGVCLDKVLLSPYSVGRVHGLERLLQALRLDFTETEIKTDRFWGDASFTFPIVLKAACVGVDAYFRNVVAGLAVSVGGLTKSVSVAASTALLDWLDGLEDDSDYPMKLAVTLLDLLAQSGGNIRVSLPTIRTLQFLFRNHLLRRLPLDEQDAVAERCVRVFQDTARAASDVHRLHALVDATSSLLEGGIPAAASTSALEFLCHMLTHKYPRVRTYTAEQLYVLLVDRIDSSPSSIDLILETPWSSTSADLSGATQQLAKGLGVGPMRVSVR